MTVPIYNAVAAAARLRPAYNWIFNRRVHWTLGQCVSAFMGRVWGYWQKRSFFSANHFDGQMVSINSVFDVPDSFISEGAQTFCCILMGSNEYPKVCS